MTRFFCMNGTQQYCPERMRGLCKRRLKISDHFEFPALESETEVVLRELILVKLGKFLPEIEERLKQIQVLRDENSFLEIRLTRHSEVNCPRNFNWHNKWFLGIAELIEVQYDLLYQLLLQFKCKGAPERELQRTLAADVKATKAALATGIKDLETFRMTANGNPLRLNST